MAEHNFATNILEVIESSALEATTAGDTYNILAGAAVVGVSSLGGGTGVSIGPGTILNVAGYVFGADTGVDGDSTYYVDNIEINVESEGEIRGESFGIFLLGDENSINNYGYIKGNYNSAVVMFGESISIFNSGEIISWHGDGISLSGSCEVVNHGSISADHYAIDGSFFGRDVIINTGFIFGAVNLHGGNDILIQAQAICPVSYTLEVAPTLFTAARVPTSFTVKRAMTLWPVSAATIC